MTVLRTLQNTEPALHKKCTTVNFETTQLQKIITDLTDSMRAAGLIAMAAPQIGYPVRVFITEIRATKSRPGNELDELRVFINPEIINYSQEKVELYEGCGSVQNTFGFGAVIRPKEITVKAYDSLGRSFSFRCNGLLARAIQHEYDHLQGQEFTVRMLATESLVTTEFFKKNVLTRPEHQAATKITIKEFKFLS